MGQQADYPDAIRLGSRAFAVEPRFHIVPASPRCPQPRSRQRAVAKDRTPPVRSCPGRSLGLVYFPTSAFRETEEETELSLFPLVASIFLPSIIFQPIGSLTYSTRAPRTKRPKCKSA